MQSKWLAILGICGALVTGGASLRAQARFVAVGREAVAGASGLEVVTIRDQTLAACYTVFVMEATPTQAPPVELTSIDAALAQRDRRLADLSGELERSLATATPGTLGPNVLRFEWEGQKAQADYERALREHEMARLEARLIATARKMAVSGPSPCPGQP
jgi:hypothetical protein